MAERNFPKTVLITFDPNRDPARPPEFLAHLSVSAAIEDDGPTVVAEYRLVRSRRYRKNTVDADTGEEAD
jgi:hypothetical protein